MKLRLHIEYNRKLRTDGEKTEYMENQVLSTGTIAREYGPLVSSICRKMIRDPEIAKEAAQETWIEILGSIDGFKNESKLSTWIYTITRRVVIRYARREKTYTTRHLSRSSERTMLCPTSRLRSRNCRRM